MKKKLLLIVLFISLILAILFLNVWKKDTYKIDLDRDLETTLFDQYQHEQLILFFGYVGCIDVCTPRLEELNEVYTQIDTNKTAVVFINLSKVYDKELPALFAQHFNTKFYAPYVDKALLKEIKSEFNIYFAPSLSSSTDYDHTSFVYVLKKEANNFKLKSIYITTPLPIKAMINDLKGKK